MIVTRLDVRKALVEYGLTHKTNAEIDAAMASVDQEAVFLAEKAKYAIEVWDKQTPINGVDPTTVCKSHNIPEYGTAYMIKEGGRIVYFQAYDPFSGAVITPENAQTSAETLLDEYVKSVVHGKIIDMVVNQLDV